MADYSDLDAATLPEPDVAPGSAPAPASLGFVILWAPAEVGLVGAWLPVPREPRVLGRGPASEADAHPRVQAVRQSPGANMLLPAFASPALSRTQLELCQLEALRLRVKNVGRCKLWVNEIAAEETSVEPGDLVQVGSQLLLLCTRRVARIPGQLGAQHRFGEPDEHGFVGESPAMWQLRKELAFAGGRAGHVLIRGESGTGKELAAAAVHRASQRGGALVARNAATFPETLIDAELFGNAKGYPNPGMPERPGLVGAAHEGTLFLDEFAELPVSQQTRFLRVLDAGEYQRLGESQVRHANVRVVAATNRPLSDLRQDVAARFSFTVNTPNLAARREDVPLLVRHLLRLITGEDAELRARFVRADGEPNVSAHLLTRLVRGALPGNVRDLRNTLWRSLAESKSDSLDWPPSVAVQSPGMPRVGSEAPRAQPERERLIEALERNQGSLDKTWRELGLSSRFALNRLLKKHAVSLRRRSS
jgi:two-component system nitrogen regulation response regulator GlnG/two-component system response regulator HydG